VRSVYAYFRPRFRRIEIPHEGHVDGGRFRPDREFHRG
jgi:hypothetical protein